MHASMSPTESNQPKPVAKTSIREMVTDAIRYWEPRRLIYNAVLALIVIGYFCGSLPESRDSLSFDGFLFVFILAVLSNICYCAAYIADIFAQFSGFRALWLHWRWLLFALGIAFAGIISRFFALGFFSSYHAR